MMKESFDPFPDGLAGGKSPSPSPGTDVETLKDGWDPHGAAYVRSGVGMVEISAGCTGCFNHRLSQARLNPF